jgi:SAM-dependent methyltransferase
MVLPIDDHNRFYISEDRRQQPREYFKFLVQQAQPRLAMASPRVLDIGCATGDFLYFLRTLYPDASLTGIDLEPEFVARASQAVPDADFTTADIFSGANLPADKFDLVFMSGFNYLFSQYEPWIRNVVSLTRYSAYVFGWFNPEDLDVRATVQRSGDNASSTPWNLISRRSISLFLDSLHLRHQFIGWELPIANPRCKEDPIRSWTIEQKDGHFLVVNGTQMIQRFALLRIDVAVPAP